MLALPVPCISIWLPWSRNHNDWTSHQSSRPWLQRRVYHSEDTNSRLWDSRRSAALPRGNKDFLLTCPIPAVCCDCRLTFASYTSFPRLFFVNSYKKWLKGHLRSLCSQGIDHVPVWHISSHQWRFVNCKTEHWSGLWVRLLTPEENELANGPLLMYAEAQTKSSKQPKDNNPKLEFSPTWGRGFYCSQGRYESAKMSFGEVLFPIFRARIEVRGENTDFFVQLLKYDWCRKLI